MARPIRIQFSGAFYHIISRGNERSNIYYEKNDFFKFLDIINVLCTKYYVDLFCYCLMDNHYHLFIRTKAPNLSKFMHDLNGFYSTWFNRKYKRVGHLFQGRYKSILVDTDEYKQIVSRYIHRNPIRAKMCEKATDYSYSSMRMYMSQKKTYPESLNKEFVLDDFEDIRDYWNFVHNEKYEESIKEKVFAASIMGSKVFVSRVLDRLKKQPDKHSDISNYKDFNVRSTLLEIKRVLDTYKLELKVYQKLFVYFARKRGFYSYNQIINFLDLECTADTLRKQHNRFISRLNDKSELYAVALSIEQKLKMSDFCA